MLVCKFVFNEFSDATSWFIRYRRSSYSLQSCLEMFDRNYSIILENDFRISKIGVMKYQSNMRVFL